MIFAELKSMPPKIYQTFSGPYRENDRAADRDGNDNRLPIHIAGPIIVALSLSLWGGIGFVISAFL